LSIRISKKINQKSGPIIYHVKLIIPMINRVKKTTSVTVSPSQKLSEMQH